MAENSKIQWTTHTFNPWRGCTKVHAGCKNCYAEAQAKRNPGTLGIWGPNGSRVVASEAMWEKPLKWNREAEQFKHWKNWTRPRVFCASVADVFEDWQGPIMTSGGDQAIFGFAGDLCTLKSPGPIPKGMRPYTMDDVRRRLFALIDATPNLDWLLLTKRPENIERMWLTRSGESAKDTSVWSYRSNVWLGTSVSDQPTMEKFMVELGVINDLVPVRFISAEPLLGPLDFSMRTDGTGSALTACKINLVIVGGESGRGARPCNVEWIRSIVKQCGEAGTACFVKQLGSVPVYDGAWRQNDAHEGPGSHREQCAMAIRDKKGGAIEEFPADLRVRQMPESKS